jgi:hypothetical protein
MYGEEPRIGDLREPMMKAGKVSSAIDVARNDRTPDVAAWNHVLRFLANQQHFSYGSDRRTLVPSKVSPGQNEIVTNIMLPIYRTTISLLMTRTPRLTVLPTTPSIDNITKAKASSVVLGAWWYQARMDEQMATVAKFLSSCGTAGLHSYYDPGMDKVCTEAVSPYDLIFEPYTSADTEWNWLAIRRTLDKDAVMRTYPDFAEYLKDQSTERDAGETDTKMHRDAESRIDTFRVYFKNGDSGVLVGNKWVWQGTTPDGIMPVSICRFHDVPGNIYGMAQLYPILDIQRSYNRFKNFALDIADTMSNPVWLVPSNSGISSQQITNEPGAVIRYNHMGEKPTREQGASPPAALFDIQAREHAVAFDIGGIHPSSTGKRSTGITSGVAIRELREGDLGAIEFTMQDIARAIEDQGRNVLVLTKAHISEQKMVRIMDQSVGRVVFKEIANSDIVDAPEVKVEADTLFIHKARERDEQIMAMYEKGLATPEQVSKQLSMRIGEQDALQEMVDLSHAQDLLEYAKRGGKIEISMADNLASIRKTFEEYIRSPAYYEQTAMLKQQYGMTQGEGDYIGLVAQMGVDDYVYDQYLYVVAMEMGMGQQAFGQELQQSYMRNSGQMPPQPQGPQDPAQAQQAAQQGVRTQDIGNQNSAMRQDMGALKGTPGVTGSP